MKPLNKQRYILEFYDVTEDYKVADFLKSKVPDYKLESSYYQFTKPEHIPDDIEVIFIDKVYIQLFYCLGSE